MMLLKDLRILVLRNPLSRFLKINMFCTAHSFYIKLFSEAVFKTFSDHVDVNENTAYGMIPRADKGTM